MPSQRAETPESQHEGERREEERMGRLRTQTMKHNSTIVPSPYRSIADGLSLPTGDTAS